MRNVLANIANAWVRGTLHALNGVLFAKYLSMAWGFGSTTAASLSGATAGIWMMRGKIFGVCRSAWQLHSGAAEFSADSEESREAPVKIKCGSGVCHHAAKPTKRVVSSWTLAPAKTSARE